MAMELKRGRYLAMATAFLASGILGACGSQSGTVPSPPGGTNTGSEQIFNGQPVTLSVFQWGGGITDTEFKNLISDPVKKKWPNVTLTMVRSTPTATMQNLVAAGNFPDMSITDSLSLTPLLNLGILEDLTPYIKRDHFDIGQFVPRAIDVIKGFGANGQMYALPFSLNFGVLYYNKTIFDKYALPYPKDGNTFDDLIEIAKKISGKRTDDVQPLSINGGFNRLATSLLLKATDPKTMKATLQTDEWRNAMQLYTDIMKVPGDQVVSSKNEVVRFQDQTIAMLTSYGARIGEFEQLQNSGKGIDWDMATFPVMKNAKNQGMETESHVLTISTTSKNKDDDFKIIKFLTSDHSLQEQVSRYARVSSLNDPALQKVFGSNLKTLQGKHIEAIFKNKYGDMPVPTQDELAARGAASAEVNNVVAGSEDINSALRIAEEKANAAIANLQAK